MKVLIVGAGLAGLSAAAGLIRRGHDVTVLERGDRLRAAGAGIGLWPSAMRALRRIGVEGVEAITEPVTAFDFRDARGRVLSRADLPAWRDRMGEPLRFVDRRELVRVLAAGVPAGALRFGAAVRAARDLGDRARVVLEDGSALEADLVVVADGSRSVSGGGALRYAGFTCWRGVCGGPWPAGGTGRGASAIAWGRGQRFGLNPLPGGRVYWWATRVAPERGASPNHRAELDALFAGWGSGIPEIIRATPEGDIRRDDLYDADRVQWGAGRVAAIGDAAHPMLPTLGMAGTLAIEDAMALVEEAGHTDPARGLVERMARRRHARAERLRRLSRRVGRVGHYDGAMARVRDAAVAWLPTRVVYGAVMELQDERVRL